VPATIWHSFMSVAHGNIKFIPQIPGLPLHPNQVAEQQRLSELKRVDPALAQAQIAQTAQKKTSIMPDQTRDMLKRLAETLRRANGQEAVPASTAPAAPPANPPAERTRPTTTAPDRRAEVPPGVRPRP